MKAVKLALVVMLLLACSGCSLPNVTLITIVMPGASMQVGQQNVSKGEASKAGVGEKHDMLLGGEND